LMDVGESEAEASLASHDWRIPIHILVLVGLTTGVEGNEFRGLLEARGYQWEVKLGEPTCFGASVARGTTSCRQVIHAAQAWYNEQYT